MSFATALSCVQCGRSFPVGQVSTCPACGPDEGILDVQFDLRKAAAALSPEALAHRPFSHWRYREVLPIDGQVPAGLEAIGWTPVLECPRLAAALGVARLRLKDDGRSASGSFKDRASSVGTARAAAEGFADIACASTGNAASSLAHCAAAVGLRANIFVSQNVPEGKLLQLLAYGARVFKVRGTYAQAYDLCTAACREFGWYNRNAAINPYLVEGKKTGGLELAEQCGGDAPDWVAVSVGDGCSIAGVHKGLRTLHDLGLVDWTTRMLGVQAEGAAAIAEAFRTGALRRDGRSQTYADSIDVAVPRNWRKAVNAVRDSSGAFVTVSDDDIREAVRQTGRLAGVFAEPAGAAAVAGIAAARRTGIIAAGASVAAMITGNGLKDPAGARSALGEPHVIDPRLQDVQRVVQAAGQAGRAT